MTAIQETRSKPSSMPVYLAEITPLNSGPAVYLSDRNIVVGERRYEDYLSVIKGDGGSEGVEIVFRNEAYKSYGSLVQFSEIYPLEGAGCIIKEVYLDDKGAPSEEEFLFKGALDSPEYIDLMGFRCRVFPADLISDFRY